MCIVKLDLVLGSELRPVVGMIFLVPTDYILQGCSAEEVLLLEAQFFAAAGRVIRIKHRGDVLG